jgi:hypothetical protein
VVGGAVVGGAVVGGAVVGGAVVGTKVHVAAPAALVDPAAHAVQENLDAGLYVPAAQSTQVSAPLVPDGYLPALHANNSVGSWTLVKVSPQ